jgi:hypothetical protein
MDILVAIGPVTSERDMVTASAQLVAEVGQVHEFVGPDQDVHRVTSFGQRLDGVHLVPTTSSPVGSCAASILPSWINRVNRSSDMLYLRVASTKGMKIGTSRIELPVVAIGDPQLQPE